MFKALMIVALLILANPAFAGELVTHEVTFTVLIEPCCHQENRDPRTMKQRLSDSARKYHYGDCLKADCMAQYREFVKRDAAEAKRKTKH